MVVSTALTWVYDSFKYGGRGSGRHAFLTRLPITPKPLTITRADSFTLLL